MGTQACDCGWRPPVLTWDREDGDDDAPPAVLLCSIQCPRCRGWYFFVLDEFSEDDEEDDAPEPEAH